MNLAANDGQSIAHRTARERRSSWHFGWSEQNSSACVRWPMSAFLRAIQHSTLGKLDNDSNDNKDERILHMFGHTSYESSVRARISNKNRMCIVRSDRKKKEERVNSASRAWRWMGERGERRAWIPRISMIPRRRRGDRRGSTGRQRR